MLCELPSVDTTHWLGERIAKALRGSNSPKLFLFYGPAGAGKTTLIRSIVGALPGGDSADISSPSQTMYNIYDTRPSIIHADLYRLGVRGNLSEEILDALDSRRYTLLVEWPEFFPVYALPNNYISIFFATEALQARRVRFEAYGDGAKNWLHTLSELASNFIIQE